MSQAQPDTTRLETYEQAIEYLLGRVNYERIQTEAYSTSDFKLDRMRQFLALLGHPELALPALHVAGTKGKGSTCAMLASILTAAGYRTGLFVSPHISRFEERLRVDGSMPRPLELVELINRLRPTIDQMDALVGACQPTYFEIATALAWTYFRERDADVAVLETGLGGRLDSTNLCSPVVTAITSISRDHTQILGSTVEEIAWEKAGIIKPRVPVISGVLTEQQPGVDAVITRVAQEREAPLWRLGQDIRLLSRVVDGPHGSSWRIDVATPARTWRNVDVPLRGFHQALNTALALGLIDRLVEAGWRIEEAAVHEGLAQVQWPGRVEVVSQQPLVVFDAAHNWESAKALVQSLAELPAHRQRVLVFAATRDKDYRGLLRQLAPHFDTLVMTRYLENPRSVPPAELAGIARHTLGVPVHVVDTPAGAWKLARRLALEDDAIVVTGSFFLLSELRGLIHDPPAA